MAMQMGISKILILAGTGYTGAILLKNGKLSDVIGDIQALLKDGLGKNGEGSDSDSSDAQALLRRLEMEVRRLTSTSHITVLNGSSSQIGNLTNLIVPATAVGALGYGYMWWKGMSFKDLMYVTKRNMEAAVTNLTKHLEHVSDALAATKRHLTQRIENVDGKLDEQIEISKLIKNEVTDVRLDLSQIGVDLDELHRMVSGLDGKIGTLEYKQDIANLGVLYLCNVVDGKKGVVPQALQEQLKLSGKTRGYLTSSETLNPKGLKEIDSLASGGGNRLITDGNGQESPEKIEELPYNRPLLRASSLKC
ncbi:uncharacterized protein LOC124925865 [Impatiens glandulifera]|uniref:uncharacterized protein LOC124925865 n=1 Tax=Impatiens glandulifera TaxID=253017 RepID=UPI001FB14E87|nr:uncharacterized protein LOC124925865 [Impatiens glandulifera]